MWISTLDKNTRQLQNIPLITLFLRHTKQYDHLRYISFKTVPLCNYTLLPTTIKLLGTFLEANVKAFSGLPLHS
jgi:hypothetical protein